MADGTFIFTSPSGQTHVTYPGSALMFPSLCRGIGAIPAPEVDPPQDYCGERSAMMPQRRRTRAQDRTARIATERNRNRAARTAKTPKTYGPWHYPTPTPSLDDDGPPPF